MKTLRGALLLAMVVVAMTACAPKAQDTSADEAALKADPVNWAQAYNAGDADGVAKLYTEDALLMAPGAPSVSGRAAIKDFVAADIAKTKAAGLTMVVDAATGTAVSGDMGWSSGTWQVKDGSGTDVDKGKYLSVYHRGAEGWKLIRDTWNSDMETAPAPAAPGAAPAAAAPAAGEPPAKP